MEQNKQEYIQFTGTNYALVKAFAGEDKVMAPYFCMGFSLLTLLSGDNLVNVNEGDYIFREADGTFRVAATLQE